MYKRVFPCLWFGFIGLFLVVALITAVVGRRPTPIEAAVFFLLPIGMGVFGYIVLRFVVFNMADEVLVDGDALIVKLRNCEQRIALSNIKNVTYNNFYNPSRITLMLREKVDGADAVAFIPTFRIFQHTLHPTAQILIDRVDAIRMSK